jgi:hypothetical protein
MHDYNTRPMELIVIQVHDMLTSRDSSVGIATGYGLDNRMIGVRFPAGAGNFSIQRRVQTSCGAYPASYPMGSVFFLPGVK